MATGAPKKRGAQSDFQGQRADFLEGWVLAYADASRKKTTQPMWDRLFAQYWMNFNWRSPVTESIQTAVFINTDDSWVLPIFEPESLTTDEQKEKTKIVQATQKVSSRV
jgi:hypothetical protein